MPWTAAEIPDQRGRTALITGANSGLGLESARALATKGATVLLACRSLEKATTTASALQAETGAELIPLELDLADLGSVQRAAAQVQSLDLLLNNAGVMAPPRTLSRQGFELQFAVNHLGHVALTQALLPLLKQSPAGRVVHVSSGAAYFGRIQFEDLQGEKRYRPWDAYGQSKLANAMTALELQRQLEQEGSSVQSLVAHPGLARTNLQPTSVASKNAKVEGLAYRLMDPLFQSAAMGALPQLYAATAPEAKAGVFYGPGGFGNLRGYPTSCRMPPQALDPEACARLREVSAALIGSAEAGSSR
ncbi:oxidoreductase [Synechococcus sp. A10-1-5-1]|uniref:oxidoreductase n=1 Tax=Synechococcus sp. A10-1-5-1 TaxID=2936507 RepID=UPI00200145FA|nr:oxidoreductase [Synechococcus sp. A10-1-5-1]UPM51517.1 oxidoreductase [Synechococcus sp. A10-1-5-1]